MECLFPRFPKHCKSPDAPCQNGRKTHLQIFADYFSVTKADGSITGSGVNLREKATTASNSLKKFSSGEAVTVTGQNDDWYRVSYNGGSAYVSKDYVSGNLLQYVSKVSNETTAAPVSATAKAEDTYGVVTAGSGLKLRKEASTSAEVLTVLPSGTSVAVPIKNSS